MYLFQEKTGKVSKEHEFSHKAIAELLGSDFPDLHVGEWQYCGGMRQDQEIYQYAIVHEKESGEYVGELLKKRDS